MVPALWAFCLGLHFPRIYRACSQPLTVDLLAAHQPESFPMTPEIRMVAVDSHFGEHTQHQISNI